MTPRIESLSAKKLLGKRLTMSFADNKTFELWSSFMPIQKHLQNKVGADLISMQIYSPHYYKNFNPTNEFEKWAAVEVSDLNEVPNGLESYVLPGGLYAVFIHKGEAAKAEATFRYIFLTWLPNSDYVLDDRPHFEILGAKYKRDHPDSEEEVWIPIKPR